MDTHFSGFSNSSNGFRFDDENLFASSDYSSLHILDGFNIEETTLKLNFMDDPLSPLPHLGSFDPFPSMSPGEESSDSDLYDSFLNYVNQTLMEEDMDEKSCMFHDPLALQAAEKSFYEILGQKHPLSPNQPLLSSGSPEEYSSSSTNSCDPVDPTLPNDLGQLDHVNSLVNSASFGSLLASNIFSDPESVLQFKKGLEEASKFLPKVNPLIVDFESGTLPPEKSEAIPKLVVEASRGGKNREREDAELEGGRSNKQSAVYVEEEEEKLSELFDKALLYNDGKDPCVDIAKNSQQHGPLHGSNGVKARGRKQSSSKIEVVDMRTLLVHCAQAVSVDDRRAASELLKQIRQHSSSSGDGSQRLGHYFANSLEARLAGTGIQLYTALATKKMSASAIMKGYNLYLSICPFKKVSIIFANVMILKLAEKATTLHVIDFGILYGFQWPMLIQFLSKREGGPPKLRITGIELPQPGFRPAEGVEETGRRLKKYCQRFNVPFEYNAIAQKWETIRVEDLMIRKGEMVVVNSLFRFKNLLDESVVVNSPRDAVLNLIKEINPSMFVHGVINGSYDSPFFVTRFREALFYYSSLFDVFEVVAPLEDQERLMYEREFVGREIMSVVACEGSERVERPETYKQWHVRNTRAGFKQLPLNPESRKKLMSKVMAHYHQDFGLSEDGGWLLIGWKGRLLYGISCWVPA